MPHFNGKDKKEKKYINNPLLLLDLDIKKMLKDTAEIKESIEKIKELIIEIKNIK
jgi:hypothetical protein